MKSSFNRRPTEAFDFDQSDDSEHSRLGTPKGKRGLAAGFKAASKGGHGRGRGRGQAKARGGARPKAAQDWPKQEEAPSSRVTRSTRKQDGADAGREAPPSGPVRLGPGSPALKPAEEEALVLFRRKWNFHLELTGKHLVVRVRTQTSGRESGKVSVTPLYDIGVTVSHGTIDLWTRWFFEGPDNDDVAPLAWLCADGVPPPELGARSIPSQIDPQPDRRSRPAVPTRRRGRLFGVDGRLEDVVHLQRREDRIRFRHCPQVDPLPSPGPALRAKPKAGSPGSEQSLDDVLCHPQAKARCRGQEDGGQEGEG
jgi:hypothetical protein